MNIRNLRQLLRLTLLLALLALLPQASAPAAPFTPPVTQSGLFTPGDQNTGNYTFNIAAAAPAVPEASTILSVGLMQALGVGGPVVTARRRQVAAK